MAIELTERTESHLSVQRWLDDNWWSVLVVGATAVVVVATVVLFAYSPFYITRDSALFQHAGWYIQHGGTLYVDIWDLKPPLIYAVTTLLASLSLGNMAVLHVFSVAAAAAAVIGGVVFLGLTLYRLTDDGFASVVGAFSIFGLTSVYAFPFAGIRPKYFAFLCGAAALYVAIGDRYLLSGVVAAVGAGFWQLGGGIALLVAAMALQRGGLRAAVRTVVGGITVAVLTVLPFVLSGQLTPLVVEVVIAPLYGIERYSVVGRLLEFVVELGYAVLLVPLAVYGWWRGLRTDSARYWWVAVGGSGYLFQIFLEFQGAIELILVYLFVALGVGILVANLSSPSRRTFLACIAVFLVAAPIHWHAGTTTPLKDEAIDLRDHYDVSAYHHLPDDPATIPSMQTIYWEQLKPDLCHYRRGHKQKHFVHVTGGTLHKTTCGQWPFERSPLP